MKIKDAYDTCGGMTAEHKYLGHFANKKNINAGHNTGPKISDSVVPDRKMQGNTDPTRRVDSSTPNVYRGRLQPSMEEGNGLPLNYDANKKMRI